MKSLFTSAFMLATLLISAKAFSYCDSNENFDLRRQHTAVFNQLNVGNQGQYGICYAYAGAFLVDFWRYKVDIAKNGKITNQANTSPVEAGLLHAVVAENVDEVGGDTCAVVNAISARGFSCDRMNFLAEEAYKDIAPMFHRESVGGGDKILTPYLGAGIKNYPFKSVADFNNVAAYKLPQKEYVKKFNLFYQSMSDIVTGVKTYNFDGLLKKYNFPKSFVPTRDQVFVILHNALLNKNWSHGALFASTLAANSCTGRQLKTPKLNCIKSSAQNSDVIGEIDYQISRGKPVGIHYCSKVLDYKNYDGIRGSGELASDCGAHASVIIGRKATPDRKCMYLIRNSWGKFRSYPWETSEGDIWVEERALTDNVYEVQTI